MHTLDPSCNFWLQKNTRELFTKPISSLLFIMIIIIMSQRIQIYYRKYAAEEKDNIKTRYDSKESQAAHLFFVQPMHFNRLSIISASVHDLYYVEALDQLRITRQDEPCMVLGLCRTRKATRSPQDISHHFIRRKMLEELRRHCKAALGRWSRIKSSRTAH